MNKKIKAENKEASLDGFDPDTIPENGHDFEVQFHPLLERETLSEIIIAPNQSKIWVYTIICRNVPENN